MEWRKLASTYWEFSPLLSGAVVGGVMVIMTSWPRKISEWEVGHPRGMRAAGLVMAGIVFSGAISSYQQQLKIATKDDLTKVATTSQVNEIALALRNQINSKMDRPVLLQTAPTYGNLKVRAETLSREISDDLTRHGWALSGDSSFSRMRDAKEIERWMMSRSEFFRFRFLDKVFKMRDEFSQLRIADTELDDLLKFLPPGGAPAIITTRTLTGGSVVRTVPSLEPTILPQQIETVAKRLAALARQIPQ